MLSILCRIEIDSSVRLRIVIYHKSAHLAVFKTVAQEEPGEKTCDAMLIFQKWGSEA